MAKHILVLGIGGTGSNVVSRLNNVHKKDSSTIINCIAVDTSSAELESINNITKLDLGSKDIFSKTIDDFGREEIDNYYLNLESKNLSYIENLQNYRGSNTWRVKSIIMFEEYIKEEIKSKIFDSIFESFIDPNDFEATYEIYVVTSIAGGTGSGLLIPLTTYLKSYFKAKYDTDLKATALLVLPEVYREVLTKELNIKAFANAYMVLRELNAYDICDILNNNHKDSYFKQLNKYNKTNNNPFDQIYLFDRIPGLGGSITLHEHIICDILNYMTDLEVKTIFNNKKENKSFDNYHAITLSKIKYPKDRIIQYLNAQRTYDILDQTYSKFFKQIINRIRLEHKAENNNSDLTTYFAATKIIDLSKSYNEENEINENIFVGEDYSSELYNNNSNIVVMNYLDTLLEQIPSFFDIKEYKEINEYIETLESFSDSKKRSTKQKAKRYIEKNIKNIKKKLISLYEYSINFFNEEEFDLSKKFIDKEPMGDHLSFVNNLFFDNNNCLPGAIQISRLAELYVKLSVITFGFEKPTKKANKNKNINNIDIDDNNAEDDFNEKLFEIGTINSPSISDDTYVDNGNKRFINLLKGANFSHLSLQALVSDLKFVFKRILETNFLLLLKENVEKYLNSYLQIIYAFDRNLTSYRKVVEDIKNRSIVNTGTIHYYHNSVEEKNQLYAELLKEDRSEITKIAKENTIFGFEFLNLVENIDNNKLENNQLMDYFNLMESKIASIVLRTEVGKYVNNNTIIKLFLEDIKNGNLNLVKYEIHSLLDSALAPVRLNKQNHDDKINMSKVLIISKNQVDYLNQSNIKELNNYNNNYNNNDKLQSFMFLIDQFAASIHVHDSVLDNELYVANCVESLKLLQIDQVDEFSKLTNGISYYSYYLEACMNTKTKETSMWSPNLYLGKKIIFDLPYISSLKDDMHNQNIIKALIYCLTNNEIKVKKYPEIKKSIYYIEFNDDIVPLKSNDEQILEGQFDKIILFFKENEYLTNIYSNKFDNFFTCLKATLPFSNVVNTKETIIKRIKKNSFYKALKENFSLIKGNQNDLNLVILSKKLNDYGLILNHNFGYITLKMIIDTFYNLVINENSISIEDSKIILAFLLNDFFGFNSKSNKEDSDYLQDYIKENLKDLLSFIKEEEIFEIINLIVNTK